MDYDEEILSKRCYKCDVQPIEDLSIHHNPTNTTTVLWNKYQVFFYENLDFSATTKIFISEYQISDILLTNNFLLCIDGNENVHVTVLKFKNTTQKQKKLLFQPIENNIKTFLQYKYDLILSLKYEYDTYFLCLHKLSTDLKITKKTILIPNTKCPVMDKKSCMMVKTPLTDEILTSLTKNTPDKYQFISSIKADCNLIIICFDNAVFCCIFGSKIPEEEIELIQLYSCPTEVKGIEIIHSYCVISLSIGTVIRLNLTNVSAAPDIMHLNMAIQKLIAINDTFVYTDGVCLWKTEDTFSEKLKLKDLLIKLVKDFTVCSNYIICTTYTKLIYIVPLNSGTSANEAATSVKILVNNSDYLENIFAEIENNNELVKQLNKEQNYILATALSNRQDVMSNVNCNAIIYNSFNNLEDKELIFTEDVSQYFEENIYIFVINLSFDNTHQQIYDILSNIADISTLNITMISNNKILKIITIELERNLKNTKYVAPLSMENLSTDFYIEIKIISNIPRAFDGGNNEIILYKHKIVLRSEHFICIPRDNYKILKKQSGSIKNEMATANNDSVEADNNTLKEAKDWSLYMKLPVDYEEKFKNIDFDNENLDKSKTLFIHHQLNNDKFLNSQDTVHFIIGTEKVILEVENDGFSESILRISSKDLEKALDIRQFISRLIYKDNGCNNEKEKQLINWNFYARTENIQKSIKNAVTSSSGPEELHRLIETFEKNIIGSLPV